MTSEKGDNNFPDTIAKLLQEGNTVHALTLFTDNKNSEEVYNNSWDLVPVVARFLSSECEGESVEVFKCCQKLIDIIAEQSKPEEVLLQFIEEIETAGDDTKFVALLKPSEKVLLRVPDKRITSLAWCFNAIKSYLSKLETPEDLNLSPEERLLLDSNEVVIRITNLYNELLGFCNTFVEELRNIQSGNVQERKQVIGKFLVDLLGKPLAFLDMSTYKNTKPEARTIAEKLVEEFSTIIHDPFIFFEIVKGSHESDLVKPNDLSLGVLYYLILGEEIGVKTIPKVYNSVYILDKSLSLINKLLVEDNQFVLEKGVFLASAVLKNIDRLELSYLLLDGEHHSKFCKCISNIIVHNQYANIRKLSLQTLQTYLWAFEHKGRYLIIYNLMRSLSHSGLKGNMITQYKEMITEELRHNQWNAIDSHYKNYKLFKLLDEFTNLRNREETDLVDESDQIVSTLNLLRYLTIADKTGVTGIDNKIKSLEDGYFKYLKTGIQISREHYKLRIKEVNEERDPKKQDCEVSVTVSGKNLMELPSEKKIEIMNMSLTTLDVIDSLLSRLNECLNVRIKS